MIRIYINRDYLKFGRPAIVVADEMPGNPTKRIGRRVRINGPCEIVTVEGTEHHSIHIETEADVDVAG